MAGETQGRGLTQQLMGNLAAMRVVTGHALEVPDRTVNFPRLPVIAGSNLNRCGSARTSGKNTRQRLVALTAQAYLSIVPKEHIFVIAGMRIMAFHTLPVPDRRVQGCIRQLFLQRKVAAPAQFLCRKQQ